MGSCQPLPGQCFEGAVSATLRTAAAQLSPGVVAVHPPVSPQRGSHPASALQQCPLCRARRAGQSFGGKGVQVQEQGQGHRSLSVEALEPWSLRTLLVSQSCPGPSAVCDRSRAAVKCFLEAPSLTASRERFPDKSSPRQPDPYNRCYDVIHWISLSLYWRVFASHLLKARINSTRCKFTTVLGLQLWVEHALSTSVAWSSSPVQKRIKREENVQM